MNSSDCAATWGGKCSRDGGRAESSLKIQHHFLTPFLSCCSSSSSLSRWGLSPLTPPTLSPSARSPRCIHQRAALPQHSPRQLIYKGISVRLAKITSGAFTVAKRTHILCWILVLFSEPRFFPLFKNINNCHTSKLRVLTGRKNEAFHVHCLWAFQVKISSPPESICIEDLTRFIHKLSLSFVISERERNYLAPVRFHIYCTAGKPKYEKGKEAPNTSDD